MTQGDQYKQRGEYEITLGKHSGRPRHNKAFDKAIELSDRLIRLNRLMVITPSRIGTIKEKNGDITYRTTLILLLERKKYYQND